MPRLIIVTIITAACATSPRAAPSPSPNVSPRDTAAADTTGIRPDTGITTIRSELER